MTLLRLFGALVVACAALIGQTVLAQQASEPAPPPVWPTGASLSGNAFLPEGLLKLQNDVENSPVSLWLDKGKTLWSDTSRGASCQSCHASASAMATRAAQFPRVALASSSAPAKTLISLEDQIVACRQRSGNEGSRLEGDDVLALSALLQQAAQGQTLALQAPEQAGENAQWQMHLANGARLFETRIGRINLACVHCHDQNIGKSMRAEVISPGHPTGFPIYRMGWQRLGSVERRLRACFSGVQAQLPPVGAIELRELELFLKVRAKGMPLDGPSIRR